MVQSAYRRFNLDTWRSQSERISMVMDPDCPLHVLEWVITLDTDTEVVLSTLMNPSITDELVDLIRTRYDLTHEQMQRLRMSREQHDLKLKAFCATPWNHVATTAEGKLRMCCQMINGGRFVAGESVGMLQSDDGEFLTTEHDITVYRNAPAWKKIRAQMLQGQRPEVCKLCWDEEDNGIGSRRQRVNGQYPYLFTHALANTRADGSIEHQQFPIAHLDLRFGNKCNLACRSCGPSNSDQWYRDWHGLHDRLEFGGDDDTEIRLFKDRDGKLKTKDSRYAWHEHSQLLAYINDNLQDIDRLYFTGGEPTISHTHRDLLDQIIATGHASRITLEYNTNMAAVPPALFDKWKQFKSIHLGMSLDGMGPQFEYIRHPGRWDAVLRNLRRLDTEPGLDHVQATVTMVVGVYNVLHLLDMLTWWQAQAWQRLDHDIIIHNLYGPVHLNAQNLPQRAKDAVTQRYLSYIEALRSLHGGDRQHYGLMEDRLMGVLQHINSQAGNPQHWRFFGEWTSRLDALRGEDWRVSLPELAQLLSSCDDV